MSEQNKNGTDDNLKSVGEILAEGFPQVNEAEAAARKDAARRQVVAQELRRLGISEQELRGMRLSGIPTDPKEDDRVEGALGAALQEADALNLPIDESDDRP